MSPISLQDCIHSFIPFSTTLGLVSAPSLTDPSFSIQHLFTQPHSSLFTDIIALGDKNISESIIIHVKQQGNLISHYDILISILESIRRKDTGILELILSSYCFLCYEKQYWLTDLNRKLFLELCLCLSIMRKAHEIMSILMRYYSRIVLMSSDVPSKMDFICDPFPEDISTTPLLPFGLLAVLQSDESSLRELCFAGALFTKQVCQLESSDRLYHVSVLWPALSLPMYPAEEYDPFSLLSPLAAACLRGEVSLVSLMLASLETWSCPLKADDLRARSSGLSPLVCCAMGQSLDCLLLLKDRLGEAEFRTACRTCDGYGMRPLAALLRDIAVLRELDRGYFESEALKGILGLLLPYEMEDPFPDDLTGDVSEKLVVEEDRSDIIRRISEIRSKLISIYRKDIHSHQSNAMAPAYADITADDDIIEGINHEHDIWEPGNEVSVVFREALVNVRVWQDEKDMRWEGLKRRLRERSFGPNVRTLGKVPAPERKWMVLARCISVLLEEGERLSGKVMTGLKQAAQLSPEESWTRLRQVVGGRTSLGKADKFCADLEAWSRRIIDLEPWQVLKNAYGNAGEALGRTSIAALPENRITSALILLCDCIGAVVRDGELVHGQNLDREVAVDYFTAAELQKEERQLRRVLDHDYFNIKSRCIRQLPLTLLLTPAALVAANKHKLSSSLPTHCKTLEPSQFDNNLFKVVRTFERFHLGAESLGITEEPRQRAGGQSVLSECEKLRNFRSSSYCNTNALLLSDELATHILKCTPLTDAVLRDSYGVPLLLQLCRVGLWESAKCLVSLWPDPMETTTENSLSGGLLLDQVSVLWPGGVKEFCKPYHAQMPTLVRSSGINMIQKTYLQRINWKTVPLHALEQVSPIDVAIYMNRTDFIQFFFRKFRLIDVPLRLLYLSAYLESPHICLDLMQVPSYVRDTVGSKWIEFHIHVLNNYYHKNKLLDTNRKLTYSELEKYTGTIHTGNWLKQSDVAITLAKRMIVSVNMNISQSLSLHSKLPQELDKRSNGGLSTQLKRSLAIVVAGELCGLCMRREDNDVLLLDGSNLSVASLRNNIRFLPMLLPAPLTAWGGQGTGHTILHELAEAGDEEALTALMERGLWRVFALDVSGRSPVYCALAKGYTLLAKTMLLFAQEMEDRHERDPDNIDPYHFVPFPKSRGSKINKISMRHEDESRFNIYLRHTIISRHVNIQCLFGNAAAENLAIAENNYIIGRGGSNTLEWLLVDRMAAMESQWRDICACGEGLVKLVTYLQVPSGCVLESLSLVQVIINMLKIPFHCFTSGEKVFLSHFNPSRYSSLTPAKILHLLPWQSMLDLVELLIPWLKGRCTVKGQHQSPSNLDLPKQILFHCHHISLVSVGEFQSPFAVHHPDVIQARANDAPVSSSSSSQFAYSMLSASPTSSVMFAVPKHVVQETRVVYRVAGRMVSAAQRMASFLESWRTDSAGIVDGLNLGYKIIEFARTMCLVRMLVTLTTPHSTHDDLSSKPLDHVTGKDDLIASDVAVRSLQSRASPALAGSSDRKKAPDTTLEFPLHPLDQRLEKLRRAQAEEEFVRLEISRLTESSGTKACIEREGCKPSSSDSGIVFETKSIPSEGALTNISYSLRNVSAKDFACFLTVGEELSERLVGIRRGILEAAALLVASLGHSDLCRWICLVARKLFYQQDVFDLFAVEGDDVAPMEPEPSVEQGGGDVFLSCLQHLTLADVALAASNHNAFPNEQRMAHSMIAAWGKVRGGLTKPSSSEYLQQFEILVQSMETSAVIGSEGGHLSLGPLESEILSIENVVKLRQSIYHNDGEGQSRLMSTEPSLAVEDHTNRLSEDKEDLFTTFSSELVRCYATASGLLTCFKVICNVKRMSWLYLSDPQLWLGTSFLNPLVALLLSSAMRPRVLDVKRGGLDHHPLVSYVKLVNTEHDLSTCGEELDLDCEVLDFCKRLLRFGSDPLRADSMGRCAVAVAALTGQAEVLRLLLKRVSPQDLKNSSSTIDNLVWHTLMACPPPAPSDFLPSNAIIDRRKEGLQAKDTSSSLEVLTTDDMELNGVTDAKSFSKATNHTHSAEMRHKFIECLRILIGYGFSLQSPGRASWSCEDLCAVKQVDAILPLLLKRNKEIRESSTASIDNLSQPLSSYHICLLGRLISAEHAALVLDSQRPELISSSLLTLEHLLVIETLHRDVELHAQYVSEALAVDDCYVDDHQNSNVDTMSASSTSYARVTAVYIHRAIQQLITGNRGGKPRCPVKQALELAAGGILAAVFSQPKVVAQHEREALTTEWNMLHLSIAGSNVDKINIIINRLVPARPSSTITLSSPTAVLLNPIPTLLLCCYYDQWSAMQDLIAIVTKSQGNGYSASINTAVHFPPIHRSCTALSVATRVGSIECVKILLANGAESSRDLLVECVVRGYHEGIALLLLTGLRQRGDGRRGETLDELLAATTDETYRRSANGGTLLHVSSRRGWSVLAAELLKSGITPDIRDDDGLTALDCSIGSGHAKVTRALALYYPEARYAASIIAWNIRMYLSHRYSRRKQKSRLLNPIITYEDNQKIRSNNFVFSSQGSYLQ